MSREAIKDGNFRTIGYIEAMPDTPLATIIRSGTSPRDPNFRTIAQGNVLLGLGFK